MWRIGQIELRPSVLDFTSSGQAKRDVTELLFDGELFSNALELVKWSVNPFQALVCEACGIDGCAPGNWLALRRFSDMVVFIPDFEGMSAGEWDRENYSAPRTVRQRGAPLLSPARYVELRGLVPQLPELDAVGQLTGEEAVWLAQLEAPQRVLGSFPAEPNLDENVIAAVSEEDQQRVVSGLRAALGRYRAHARSTIELAEPGSMTCPTIYLDDVEYTEWRPLVFSDDTVSLHFEPGLILRLAEAGAV